MRIEFDGFCDRKSICRQRALVELPSSKFLFRRLALAAGLGLFLFLVIRELQWAKQYTGRVPFKLALWVPILLLAIYFIIIHPYIAFCLMVLQVIAQPKEELSRKGEISSEGIQYDSPHYLLFTPWSKIYQASQTDDLVVLFVEYDSPIAFPRNLFKRESDWQQFNRWVDYYVKDRS